MGWWSKAKLYWSLRGSWGRVKLGKGVGVYGRIIVLGSGRVLIGAGARLDAHQSAIVLTAYENAEIVIGEGAFIESGVCIEACSSIRIGPNARIRAFAMLLDNHFHQLEGDRDILPESRPIVVEEGADIGPRAILLPGAYVGRGTLVGPCSVLSRRTPQDAVMQGNPAVVKKMS